MANTAVARTPLKADLYGATAVTPVVCVIDTPDSYLTVYTPASDSQAAIVGIWYAEAGSHLLTIGNGAEDDVGLEMPINSGIIHGLFEGILYLGQPGKALRIKSNAAISGPMLFYVIEAYRFKKNQ